MTTQTHQTRQLSMIRLDRRCTPHSWELPAASDDVLVCQRCGRALTRREATPEQRAAILNAFARRGRLDDAKRLSAWLDGGQQ